jgi:universal stress protein E
MKSYSHILVGIDSSNACLSAVRTAVRVASHGVPITMLHVVDPKLLSVVQQSSEMTESEFIAGVSQHVLTFVANAGVAGTGMKVKIEIGDPVIQLTEACARDQSDLLVLGTRGTKHGPNQIGTVATKCVRKMPADVLLVREGANGPFRRIVACVDFSQKSANVVRTAMRIADIDNAELDCVFVFKASLNTLVNYGNILLVSPNTGLRMPSGLKEDLRDFLRPILAGSRLTLNSHVLVGSNCRNRIFEHARESKADLVVLGSHSDSGIHSLLMGTTVENIVTHAPCSVLAVRPTSVAVPEPPVPMKQR